MYTHEYKILRLSARRNIPQPEGTSRQGKQSRNYLGTGTGTGTLPAILAWL